jgi:hypothetical protein
MAIPFWRMFHFWQTSRFFCDRKGRPHACPHPKNSNSVRGF